MHGWERSVLEFCSGRLTMTSTENCGNVLADLPIPIVGAPMAGGPTTVDLVTAVSGAGALGFLAGATISPAAIRYAVAGVRDRGVERFGVNVFVPEPGFTPDYAALRAYRHRLSPVAAALGAQVPDVVDGVNDYAAKVDVLVESRVPWVSFTFGLPRIVDVARLKEVHAQVVVTVTSPHDARDAADRGADYLVVQGPLAGGHRSTFSVGAEPPDIELRVLLDKVSQVTSLPLIAAGGVSTGADVAQLLNAGASAVAVGTLLLRCPEAGTHPVRRDALADPRFSATVVTRAFSGRPARGLSNLFHREFNRYAPAAYPEVNAMTGPLREAAMHAANADMTNVWAGAGFRSARADPAADVIKRLWDEAQSHLANPGS